MRVDTTDLSRFEYGLDKPLELKGDWAVTADWHVPLYDAKLVNKFLDEAVDYNNLLIAGDFLNGDSLSQYYPKQKSAGIEKEMSEARDLMEILCANFKNIAFLRGNHDYRYTKAAEYRESFVDSMEAVFSGINHNPLAISAIKKCHVLTAHTHHCAMGWDASGEYVVGELGGFFNIQQTEYLQGTTSFPNWCNGYWFITNGKPDMVSYGSRGLQTTATRK